MSKIPKFMIYDGRYRFEPESAVVMDTEETLEEAKLACDEQGDAVVVDSGSGEIVYDPMEEK